MVREVEGTAPYTFLNPAIAAGGFWVLDFETDEPETGKYLPFDHVTVTNLDTVDVKVYPNQGKRWKIVPAGTIIKIPQEGLRTLKVENIDGATAATANKIEFETGIEKTDADKEAYKAAKNPGVGSLLGLVSWLV
jgi:hypothetical protein